MSPPLLDVEGVGQGNVSLVAPSVSTDSVSPTCFGLKERNYLGLSDSSSVDSSVVSDISEENNFNLNLKATELRLGLPGSQSPERDPDFNLVGYGKLDEKPLFPLLPLKDSISSSSQKVIFSHKRGFSDTMDDPPEIKVSSFTDGKWMFNVARSEPETPKHVGHGKNLGGTSISAIAPSGLAVTQSAVMKEVPSKASQEEHHSKIGTSNKINGFNYNSSSPAAKAQVVGWPPIRSFRKNTLATSSKNNEEVDGKPGTSILFVKVSMDGAPYLRKVDLRMYSAYEELSSALEKMFHCFTLGQCGSQSASGKEMLSESKLKDLLHGSEYVLTYEDKDGDWMLVGDVPWEMFIDSCKRLKIMKGSDAIGLGLAQGSQGNEKSKCRN